MQAASCSSVGHSGPSATEIVALFLDVVAAEVVNQSSIVMFSLIIVLLSIQSLRNLTDNLLKIVMYR